MILADYPGQPAKVPHIRMQLALDAKDQHQNITDNNNEVLNVAYSASPTYTMPIDGLANFGYKKHYWVKHSANEFANGHNHINGIENF